MVPDRFDPARLFRRVFLFTFRILTQKIIGGPDILKVEDQKCFYFLDLFSFRNTKPNDHTSHNLSSKLFSFQAGDRFGSLF